MPGSESDEDIDEAALLEALEEADSDDDDDVRAPGSRQGGPMVRMENMGDDLVLRILGLLSVTQLCTLSGVSRWGRRNANRDSLWKALYFERWNDPQSHHAEREGKRLGWKKVYEIKDTAVRRDEKREEERNSAQDAEDEECQEAFRAMQAAQRSQALHKKHLELDRATQRSAIDIIHDAILEFKSHCKFAFPEAASGGSVAGLRAGAAGAKGQAASERDATSSISSTPRAPPDAVSVGVGAAGNSLPAVPSKREAAATPAPGEAAAPAGAEAQACGQRTVTADKGPASSIMKEPPPPNAHGLGASMFGRAGFYSSYSAGHLRNFLQAKLKALPHKHQLEVCVCKLTGRVHLCSRDSGARGCELAYPNDDGFFVCPITGIIWEGTRHMVHNDQDEEDGEGEAPGDYEGGSKSFCNLVRQGYECERDPSNEMGWGTWLQDREVKSRFSRSNA